MNNRLPGIRLRLAASRRVGIALASLHLVVGAVILVAPVVVALKLPLLLLMALHGAWNRARIPGSSPGAITEVQLEADGSAYLLRGEGEAYKASLRPDTLVTPWVILLRFDLQVRRRPAGLLVCPDALPPAEMRRLRTLLRFAVVPPSRGISPGR